MRSSFQFINYKVDNLRFSCVPATELIRANIFPGNLITEISLRNPIFIKSENTYYGGFDCIVSLKNENLTKNEHPIFSLQSGITGAFCFEQRLDEKMERNLVLKQIPTILFPYLRATITAFLANAGFGSIIVPLINMHTVAEDYKNINVEIVE